MTGQYSTSFKKMRKNCRWFIVAPFLLSLLFSACTFWVLFKAGPGGSYIVDDFLLMIKSEQLDEIEFLRRGENVSSSIFRGRASTGRGFLHEKLNLSRIIHNPDGREEGVIISSYFNFRSDPRNKNVSRARRSFESIYNFYWSVVHNRLNAIIFYDEFAFDDALVEKWARPPNITFVKIYSQPHWYESNPLDLRFDLYNEYLPYFKDKYKWFMISDLDMIYNRNPFVLLNKYEKKDGKTFFGSFDTSNWENGASGLQMRQCFGNLTATFTNEREWSTPNGCAGLWAGKYQSVKCVLSCMARVHSNSPVKDHLTKQPCDMGVHDYCVHFGGCFKGQVKGEYQSVDETVLWGKDTMGFKHSLFGPSIQLSTIQTACIDDSWAVSHLRCGKKQKWPICYDHSSIFNQTSGLRKYFQVGYPTSKSCKLDGLTNFPLPSANLSVRAIRRHEPIRKYLLCSIDSSC